MENKDKLHGLDLFSGIGGISCALDEWVRPIAYCEQDRYAQAVLLSRMASGDIRQAPIWDDVRTLHEQVLPCSPDIIYGGFPCQDISVAGHGKGLGGERSGLFFQIMRLAEEIKPAFIFLENVPAIRTRGLDRVLEELTKKCYDSRWCMLSAEEIGANHRRQRWFLLAHSRRELRAGSVKFRTDGMETAEQNAYQSERSSEMADTKRTGLEGRVQPEKLFTHGGERPAQWWDVEPNVGRVANGIPKRVDRLKCLGNAVVPEQAKVAFKYLMGLK